MTTEPERLPWQPEKVTGLSSGQGWVAQDADGRWLWGISWRYQAARLGPAVDGHRPVLAAIPGRRRGGRAATRDLAIAEVRRWANQGRPDD